MNCLSRAFRILAPLALIASVLATSPAWAQGSTAELNGATPTVNAALELGSLEETVTVEAAAPLVDVRSAGISSVIENERIVELPLHYDF